LDKSILIVSYIIGNDKSVGGKRWLNYSNYLSKIGYSVSILATKNNIDFKSIDNEIKVYSITSKYPKVLEKNNQFFLRKIQYKLSCFYRKLWVKGTIYDKGKNLEFSLTKKVNKIIRENNIRNIIVSGAPFSLLYFITKHFRNSLNIICDFRDPWSWGDNYGMSNLSKKRFNYENSCEKFVLKYSNHILCASDDLAIVLNSKLTSYNKNSIVLINSFSNYYIRKFKSKKSNKISISHIGTIAIKTEKYWKKFLDLIELSCLNIEVNIYGNNNLYFHEYALRKRDLNINFFERLNEEILMEKLSNSSFSLLFKKEGFSNTYPTKFFNYIYSKVPILTFSENGNFANEIKKNKIGIIFNENTNVKDFDTLLSSYNCKGYDTYDISKFKLDKQIQKLIKVFE
jgi:hypothetical protein